MRRAWRWPSGWPSVRYLGYFYTVTELSWRVRLSVWMILAVVLAAAVLMRLLVISRRRVAFAQRLAAFRAAQAEREREASGEEQAAQGPNLASWRLTWSISPR